MASLMSFSRSRRVRATFSVRTSRSCTRPGCSDRDLALQPGLLERVAQTVDGVLDVLLALPARPGDLLRPNIPVVYTTGMFRSGSRPPARPSRTRRADGRWRP